MVNWSQMMAQQMMAKQDISWAVFLKGSTLQVQNRAVFLGSSGCAIHTCSHDSYNSTGVSAQLMRKISWLRICEKKANCASLRSVLSWLALQSFFLQATALSLQVSDLPWKNWQNNAPKHALIISGLKDGVLSSGRRFGIWNSCSVPWASANLKWQVSMYTKWWFNIGIILLSLLGCFLSFKGYHLNRGETWDLRWCNP